MLTVRDEQTEKLIAEEAWELIVPFLGVAVTGGSVELVASRYLRRSRGAWPAFFPARACILARLLF